MDLLERGEKHQLPTAADKVTSRDLHAETRVLQQTLENRIAEIKDNIFFSKEDEAVLEQLRKDLSNRLTNTEFDTKKLNATD